jgi:hypothetical protein
VGEEELLKVYWPEGKQDERSKSPFFRPGIALARNRGENALGVVQIKIMRMYPPSAPLEKRCKFVAYKQGPHSDVDQVLEQQGKNGAIILPFKEVCELLLQGEHRVLLEKLIADGQ